MINPKVTESHFTLCPSAKCESGSILLGVIKSNGSVAFLSERQRVDEFFSRLAHEGRAPEKRFRFADVCRKGGCQQWTGSRCGIIDQLAANNPRLKHNENLPDCGIREDCRWFFQLGTQACAICPHVITDMNKPAL